MQLELGQVVRSLAGRDWGKNYLIIGFIVEGRVLLADGRVRTVDRPKKKNVKHLQPYRCVFPEIKEKIQRGVLNDNAVRDALNNLLSKENNEYNPPSPRVPSVNG